MLILTSQINVKFTLFVYNMSGSKVTRLYSQKNNWYIICDKKNLPWFVIWYDCYPTRCVISIPSPRLGNRKHKTRWIKIISQTMGDPIYLLNFQKLYIPICIFKKCHFISIDWSNEWITGVKLFTFESLNVGKYIYLQRTKR
jgi:hypothetical protein